MSETTISPINCTTKDHWDILRILKSIIGYNSNNQLSFNVTDPMPQWLKDKFLFLGYYANISGGKMQNELDSDWLSVTGAVGSEVYATPNTATYKAADTDYCWWKTDGSQSITTTARLIGYDFARTIVKYDNVAPYTLRWIGILKAGATLTTAESNVMRDLFDLSDWWSGVQSLHGNVKGNRASAQSVWVPEPVVPLIATILSDGHTIHWGELSDESTLTKDAGTGATSQVRDKLGGAVEINVGSTGTYPIWTAPNELEFNGIDNDFTSNAIAKAQPIYVYMVIKPLTWVIGRQLFTIGTGTEIAYYGVTPNIYMWSGTNLIETTELVMGVYSVARFIFNGVGSSIQINANAKITGNAGATGMSKISIACMTPYGNRGNMKYKEWIFRDAPLSVANEAAVLAYLTAKC